MTTLPPDNDPALGARELPLVKMADGLLACPHCGSWDLMPSGTPDVLVCDDCAGHCAKFADQCPECGSRGVTQLETIGFSAPGQAPSEAPRKIVKRCDACGYTNA